MTGDGVIAFLAAVCAGWIGFRLTGLVMRVNKYLRDERDRKAKLEWFKRRGPH